MSANRFLYPILISLFLGQAAAADTKATAGKSASENLTAAQVVDKFISARGGLSAWHAVKAISWTGKMDAGSGDSAARSARYVRSSMNFKASQSQRAAPAAGTEADAGQEVQLPFSLEMKRPSLSRLEIQFAGKTALQIYDGSNGWKLRPFLNRDEVESFTPEELRASAGRWDLDGPLLDYAAKGTEVALEDVEPVKGKDAYKLKLTLKNGDVQHVWIDTHSFLDVKLDGTPRRMDGKMRPVWVYQSDFRPVKGVVVPFMIETAVDGYSNTHRMTVEKVSVNPHLDDALFAKPGGV